MSSVEGTGVDYEAVLADIEARITKLQTVADGIREMLASGTSGSGPTRGPGGGIRPDAFLKLSIPDATKKLLETARVKQSTQEIIDALQKGGLPPSKYNTIYSILSRREKQVGDIINMKGDWALAEWYPNHRKGKGKETSTESSSESKKESEKATA
jgi:hypothetical protein